MQVVQFIASNAAAALKQIHQQLGPEAVVLSVRSLPAQGMSRLLPRAGRIEVLASLPKTEAPQNTGFPPGCSDLSSPLPGSSGSRWRSIGWLESMGLLPPNAERLQAHLAALHGAIPPPLLDAEWSLVRASLDQFWRDAVPLKNDVDQRPHVFIGPPGSGKTAVLCKWLTLSVLTEEHPARVYRLDGKSANTADHLAIHCEMLGTPIERFWSLPVNRGELQFVDVPGVEAHDGPALAALRAQLAEMPNARIHLVLNAAYETATLFAQWSAFSMFNPEDLIFTHLDEEPRRVKLWNFVFGTSCPIRFLSAGQKIPGEFCKAHPELLLPAPSDQGSAAVSMQ